MPLALQLPCCTLRAFLLPRQTSKLSVLLGLYYGVSWQRIPAVEAASLLSVIAFPWPSSGELTLLSLLVFYVQLPLIRGDCGQPQGVCELELALVIWDTGRLTSIAGSWAEPHSGCVLSRTCLPCHSRRAWVFHRVCVVTVSSLWTSLIP